MYLFCLLTATVICNCVLSESTNLPHSACRHIGDWLQCDAATVELPADFEVSKIPADVSVIELNMPAKCESCYEVGVYTYTVNQNAQPFPALQNLETVNLFSMQGQDGGLLPVQMLLANVKQRITFLGMYNCKIGNLSSDYFKGFTSLELLYLRENGIAEITPSTFQSTSTPVLRGLRLDYNRITSFDWAALQALANSLEEVNLNYQKPGLRTIRRSSPKFSFKKLKVLGLENSTLPSIPKELLETITNVPARGLGIRLKGNPFCALHTDCFCCKMQNVFDWANQLKPQTAGNPTVELEYTCGSKDNREQRRLRIVKAKFQLEIQDENSGQFLMKNSSFSFPRSNAQC